MAIYDYTTDALGCNFSFHELSASWMLVYTQLTMAKPFASLLSTFRIILRHIAKSLLVGILNYSFQNHLHGEMKTYLPVFFINLKLDYRICVILEEKCCQNAQCT